MARKAEAVKENTRPTVEQLRTEIGRTRERTRFGRAVRSTIYVLVTVAAAAILIATLLIPVLRIYGNSMVPTLREGEIVAALKGSSFKQGEIVAFYFNNKILVKRVICGPGDWVNILDDGSVIVNGSLIDEPYLQEKALGETNIKLPYQVPENRIFVMGDHRSVSIDSRNTSVGCVADDQIVGRLILRVWPFEGIGAVE